ncbi:tetratricopeptide repeat protein [Streptomyces sp. NPDC008086]|uniref:tetratricopeptide repeat protein n=1 Tax=Streptomyces sp. NPDC008086 TaxID=3364807 RepID=UPI0036E073E1
MEAEEAAIRRHAEAGATSAMVRLAALLNRRGRTDEAEPWYRRAAETGGDETALYLARFLHRLGATDEAESWYRQAAGVVPGDLAAVHCARDLDILGLTDLIPMYEDRDLHGMGLTDQPETWYLRRSDDTAYAVAATADLAQLLYERGQTEDALLLYAQALERNYDLARRGAPYLHALYPAPKRLVAWATDLIAQGRFGAAEAVLGELEIQEENQYRFQAVAPQRLVETFVQGEPDWSTMAMTMIATAAVIPFLQTIMAKAGEDGYAAIRSAIQRLSGSQENLRAEPDDAKNVIIHMPVSVSDDALRRLMSLDLAALMRTSNAGAIEVSWDDDQQEWTVVIRN